MINPQEGKNHLTVLDRVFGVGEKIDALYYEILYSDRKPIKIRTLCAPNYLEELWVIEQRGKILLIRIMKERVIGYNCYKYDWTCNFISEAGGKE